MSSNPNKVYLSELGNANTFAGSTEAVTTPSSFTFEQIATAAEVIGDYVAAAMGLIGAYSVYRVLGLGQGIVYPVQMVIDTAMAFAVLFVIMLDREGIYRNGSGMLWISESERTLRVSVQAFLLLLPITFFSEHILSRWVLGIGMVIVPIAVIFEKRALFSIVRYLHIRGRGVRKTIIYGAGFTAKSVYSALLRSRKLGINPVVFVDDDEEQIGKTIYALAYHREQCAPVIRGPITSRLIESYGADMVIVAIPSIQQEKLCAVADEAKRVGATLAFVPSRSTYEHEQVNYMDIDGVMFAIVNPAARMHLYEGAKRLMDVVGSVIALVLFSPLLALIALAVRLDSEGPIIFRQQRVGKNGCLFDIYKFRTMWADAPQYKFSPSTVEDERITRVGRFLRKSSLDELPQIFNVLKGEMSLVGPRPEMPFIVDLYGPREWQRLSVTPGITGMWQLSADRAYLIHENLHYDLYYIQNRGFFMDLAILLHTTIFAVKGI